MKLLKKKIRFIADKAYYLITIENQLSAIDLILLSANIDLSIIIDDQATRCYHMIQQDDLYFSNKSKAY